MEIKYLRMLIFDEETLPHICTVHICTVHICRYTTGLPNISCCLLASKEINFQEKLLSKRTATAFPCLVNKSPSSWLLLCFPGYTKSVVVHAPLGETCNFPTHVSDGLDSYQCVPSVEFIRNLAKDVALNCNTKSGIRSLCTADYSE